MQDDAGGVDYWPQRQLQPAAQLAFYRLGQSGHGELNLVFIKPPRRDLGAQAVQHGARGVERGGAAVALCNWRDRGAAQQLVDRGQAAEELRVPGCDFRILRHSRQIISPPS